MKLYLKEFYNKCSYKKEDIIFLLNSYEIIANNGNAMKIVDEILLRYEQGNTDGLKEFIMENSPKISELTGVHVYTVDLIIYSLMTKHLKESYIKNNIDLSIYDNTVLDLRYAKGWTGRFFSGAIRFAVKLLRFFGNKTNLRSYSVN